MAEKKELGKNSKSDRTEIISNKETKVDKIQELVEEIKKKYGIDVEPVKKE